MTIINVIASMVVISLLSFNTANNSYASELTGTYTIKEVYEKGETAWHLKNSKTATGNFHINSKAYAFNNDEWVSYYFNSVQGPQMRSVLKKDTEIDFVQLDSFIKDNRSNIVKVSLFYDGYALIHLRKYIIIFPITSETISLMKNISW